jgi:S-adenosylmethionine hydrolase
MKRTEEKKGPAIVTLITDFGYRGEYAGAMKGAILKVNPRCQIIDITHQVSPQNILEAAFVLKNSYPYFPEGTIHVVVVDPGVGGERRPIVLRKGGHRFVGPDNGVFSFVLPAEGEGEGYEIARRIFIRTPPSPTFHGRDVFAPVAGHLSMGLKLREVGPSVKDFVRLDWPKPHPEGLKWIGQVLWADAFGNLITNFLENEWKTRLLRTPFSIGGKKWEIQKIHRTYSEGPRGAPMALFGSSGFLEIALRDGNAEKTLGLRAGDPIAIQFKSKGRIGEKR